MKLDMIDMPADMTMGNCNDTVSLSKFFIDIEQHIGNVELPAHFPFKGTTWYKWIDEVFKKYYTVVSNGYKVLPSDRTINTIPTGFRCRSCSFQKRNGEALLIRTLETIQLRNGVQFPINHHGISIPRLPYKVELGSSCVSDKTALNKYVNQHDRVNKARSEQTQWLTDKWDDRNYRAHWAYDHIVQKLKIEAKRIDDNIKNGKLTVNDLDTITRNIFYESQGTDRPIRLYKNIGCEIDNTIDSRVIKYLNGSKHTKFNKNITYNNSYIDVKSLYLEEIIKKLK